MAAHVRQKEMLRDQGNLKKKTTRKTRFVKAAEKRPTGTGNRAEKMSDDSK